jgi:DnaJ-class molecular chaperone
MKAFEGKHFYEILNVSPSADSNEIKRAYEEALEMYNEDALSTYALFTDEQRENLLQTIDEAFQTLADDEKRTEYNQMLISTGQVEAAIFSRQPQIPAQEHEEEQIPSEPGEHANATEQKSGEEKIKEIMDKITEKGIVSGVDLKQLREARGVSIADIFQRTRISKTTLERIEQNQYEDLPAEIFLKSFLKSYAEILQIDPEVIVAGYLKHRELWPGGKSFILNFQQDK